MTIPDFETLVIERLVQCLNEIDGINMVFENPPLLPVGISDVPFAYPQVGQMVNSIPNQQFGAGRVVVTRSYPVKVYGPTGDGDKDGDRGVGSIGYRALRLLIAPIRNYFTTHPLLQTDAGNKVNPLAGMHQDLAFTEGGIEYDQTEGRYVLRFDLTITMSAVNRTTA
jgi:hypothetical protein